MEGVGELEDDLALGAAFEDADDAFQGVGDVGGMHGGEDEVAGFSGGEGGLDGFVIAHFADEDDVGVLAEDVDEGAIEGADVGEDFLLDDDGAIVLVDEFDGVFDGDDFAATFLVDEVDEVIEGGSFASAGGAGDEDEAVGFAGEVVEFFGQAKFGARSNNFAAEAETEFGAVVALVEGDADAAGGGVEEGDAEFPFLGKFLLLMGVHEAAGHAGNLFGGEAVLIGNNDVAIDAIGGGYAGDEVEVGRIKVFGGGQEAVEGFLVFHLKNWPHQRRARWRGLAW